jgi:hypothetical protein
LRPDLLIQSCGTAMLLSSKRMSNKEEGMANTEVKDQS